MTFELASYEDIVFFLLRLVIAAIFAFHALPKLKGAKMMSQAMGMPAGMVLALGAVELTSSIAMILGAYLRVAAFALAVVMVGAIFFKAAKWRIPFAAMDKTGWEFDLILLAANLVVLAHGGGAIGVF